MSLPAGRLEPETTARNGQARDRSAEVVDSSRYTVEAARHALGRGVRERSKANDRDEVKVSVATC